MISEELAFNPSNALQVFAYEGFQYTISNVPGYTLQTVSGVTSGLTPTSLYFTKVGNSGYVFAISDASSTLTPSTRAESFVLTTVSGSVVLTSSNTVTIGGGRFLDGSENSLSNNSYVFYKNEPITPITLVAPFTLKTPTSTPALPPGLSFVRDTSSIFKITGTPSVTIPNSNYQIIGTQQGGSKIVTTRFNMVVSNERLRLNLSGSSIVNNMQIDTAIEPRIITAFPSAGTTQVRYTFPAFPDGIVATDLAGNTQFGSFTISNTTDPSYTFILTGTPTSNAAYAFSRIVSGTPTYTVQAARTAPLPIVENSQAFSFGFAPTILFDQSTVPQLYTDIAFDPSSIFFRAKTYFSTDVSITDIFSPDLRSDLSLVFVSNQARGYLTGTPTIAGSATYTISAIDADSNTRDYPALINVVDDSVSFSSPVGDICVNYILSRPTNNFKPGYYTTPIQFTANAASGRAVTLSAPALTGTGLSLSNGLLTGIPSVVTPLTDLVVTASVAGSPATATKTVKFAILNDVFDFTDVSASSLNFIQNVAIEAFRFPVSTLSERNVINFSQIGFPDGITINPAGFVSGTPTSSSPTAGNVTISATTGYSAGSRDFSYNLIPDSMIFVVPKTSYTYQAGDSVGTIDINGVTFSGTSVSNYDLSISPTYGLTLNSSSGILSGTWTSGLPPQELLPSSCNFAVNAQAGGLIGTLPMSFTANPVLADAMLFVGYGNPSGESDLNSWLYYTTPIDVTTFAEIPSGFSTLSYSDIKIKNNDPTNNVILASTNRYSSTGFGAKSQIFRGTRLDNISNITIDNDTYAPNISSFVNVPNTSTWYMAGTINLSEGGNEPRIQTVFIKSEDDGITWDFANAKVFGPAYPAGEELRMVSRDVNTGAFSQPYDKKYDSYLRGGVAMAYANGVFIAGGAQTFLAADTPVMVYSTDEGDNWNTVSNGFEKECAQINTENSNIWIATGSSLYKTYDFAIGTGTYSTATSTIKYSTNQGQAWFDVSGDFTMFGYEVAYGNGTWLATGVSTIEELDPSGNPVFCYLPELRYSTNGLDWFSVDFPYTVFNQLNSNAATALAPLRIGSLNFDGTHWNVFVNEETPEDGRLRLYRHDTLSDLDTDWVVVDISGSFTSGQPEQNSNTRFLSLRAPKYLYTGTPPINIALSIDTNIGDGPTFTSPTTNSFVLYQYMQITPIQISATGTGQVYLFVETADLPPGLSYNRVTNQITGAPVRIGTDSVTFYAQDNTGIRQLVLNFTTLVPRVIRKQDGAGAYTSLLRQYTEVLGAQNARDNRALPSQERALGEFMSPEAPDVITQTIDPKCRNPNC